MKTGRRCRWWWCVVSWSAVQCLAQHQWCCVGCVGGDSRRVTPGFSFSNPVAKSVGADGTAPGRVWESRLLPALITSDGGWGVVCACVAPAPHPPLFFVVLFACLFCYAGAGLCGVMWCR